MDMLLMIWYYVMVVVFKYTSMSYILTLSYMFSWEPLELLAVGIVCLTLQSRR